MRKVTTFLLALIISTTFATPNAEAQTGPRVRFVDVSAQRVSEIAPRLAENELFGLWEGGSFSHCVPTNPCTEMPNGCDTWNDWIYESAVIGNVLSPYECEITVHYRLRHCSSDYRMIQLDILSWYFTWSWLDDVFGNDCDDLKDKIERAPQIERNYLYERIENSMYEKLGLDIFKTANEYFRNSTYPPKNIDCETPDHPAAPFIIHVSKATCRSNVTLNVYNPRTKQQGKIEMSIACNTEACCTWKTYYCMDKNNIVNIRKEFIPPTNFDCSNNYPSREQIQKLEMFVKNVFGLITRFVVPTPCRFSCND